MAAYTKLTNLECTGDIKAATATVTGEITATGGVVGAVTGAAIKTVSRTATATGATIGTIPAGATFVATVASTDANHIIILPAPVPGTILFIAGNSRGYELRSSAPATVAINGGVGENAESAVGANVDVMLVCMSATRWIAWTIAAIGTFAALEAAA